MGAGRPALTRRRPLVRLLGAGLAATLPLSACAVSGEGPSTVTSDGYRVSFDAHATRNVTHGHLDGHSVTITTYVAARGEETDAVSSSVTTPTAGSAATDRRLAAAVAGSSATLGGTLESHRVIRWLGHPAEEAVIATTDRLVEERVLIAGDRLYVVEGISRAARPTFPGYDHLLATFRLSALGTGASG